MLSLHTHTHTHKDENTLIIIKHFLSNTYRVHTFNCMANLVYKRPCVSSSILVVMIILMAASSATSHRLLMPMETTTTTTSARMMSTTNTKYQHVSMAKRRVPSSGPSRRGHRKVFPIT